jgi:hypothetical protein
MVLPPSMQGSLPAGWLAFTGRELNPLDRDEGFQITSSSSLPGLFLAQRPQTSNIGSASHQSIVVATSFISSGPTKIMVVMRAPRCDHVGKTKSRAGSFGAKSLRPQQGEDQVTQQARSDEGGE